MSAFARFCGYGPVLPVCAIMVRRPRRAKAPGLYVGRHNGG